MFECKACNYTTDRSTDLNRHNDSKKHKTNLVLIEKNGELSLITKDKITPVDKIVRIEKKPIKKTTQVDEEKKYICTCSKICNSRQSLWKHKNKCDFEKPKSLSVEDVKTELLSGDNFEMKFEKFINKYVADMEKLEDLTHEVSKLKGISITNDNSNSFNNNTMCVTNNKILNVCAYINANYNEAEPLRMICQQEITKMLTLDPKLKYTVEDLLVFEHDNNTINQFIGDLIVDVYKKKDPKKQRVWASDIQRLTFLVRRVIDDSEKIWKTDKGGICVTEFLISPILEEIKMMMNEHYKKCYEQMQDPENDYMKYANKMKASNEIIYDITTKKLQKSVLTYVAPHFQLEV